MSQRVKNKKTKFKTIFRRIIYICIIFILGFLCLYINDLNKKSDIDNKKYISEIESLENAIKHENDQNKELINRKNTINSDENIENIAREQFGFIKSDEIILKPEK